MNKWAKYFMEIVIVISPFFEISTCEYPHLEDQNPWKNNRF